MSDADDLIVNGKRKVRSTTVMIDGQAVKRQNLYTMEVCNQRLETRCLIAKG